MKTIKDILIENNQEIGDVKWDIIKYISDIYQESSCVLLNGTEKFYIPNTIATASGKTVDESYKNLSNIVAIDQKNIFNYDKQNLCKKSLSKRQFILLFGDVVTKFDQNRKIYFSHMPFGVASFKNSISICYP